MNKPHWLIPEKPYETYDEYLKQYGGRSPVLKAREMAPEAVLDEVLKSGLRGRGGAGFPTARKWATVKSHWCPTRYVVCNAAEGEPGTFKDRFLIRKNPYATLEGMLIACHVVGAKEMFIPAKASFKKELERLRRAKEELAAKGLLDGLKLTIVPGPEEYLFGEERALLQVIEGCPPMPREMHYPPFEKGLFSELESPNPALVSNAESHARVPAIIHHGADSFKALGSKDTPGLIIVTVSGDVRRPGVFEMESGRPLREIFEMAGGAKPGRTLKAMYSGVTSPVLPASKFDTPADFGSLAKAGSGLGSCGFIVLDDAASVPRVMQGMIRFLYVESCSQCLACKTGLRQASIALDDLCEGRPGTADPLDRALAGVIGAPQTNRCFLPQEAVNLLPGSVEAFRAEFDDPARTVNAPRYLVPKIKDYDEDKHEFVLDRRVLDKQPDWTYAEPAEAAAR
ncbi:MAG: SLBB domain-containing protein [Elusimicrobia bacterium]|nr:SLBB domain-containing protein [Elusimicrobiota bacterium]